jgi:hypothetical protein
MEMEIVPNSIVGGVTQVDGICRLWWNGVLIWTRTVVTRTAANPTLKLEEFGLFPYIQDHPAGAWGGAGVGSPVAQQLYIGPPLQVWTSKPGGAVGQLRIVRQPAGAVDGIAFTTQPQLQLATTDGWNVSIAGVTITATILSGSGTRVGTVTAISDATGLVTFSNLGIDATSPPSDFTLQFSDGTRTVDSAPFTVSAGSAFWPNEPAGMTLISDYGFSDTIAVVTEAEIGSSGWFGRNSSGLMARVVDAADPVSPSFVVQYSYPIGFEGGFEPGTIWRNVGSGTNELFLGLKWKPSNPWEDHPSGVNKIWFQFAGGGGAGGQVMLQMRPERTLRTTTEFPSEPFTNRDRNVGSGVITLGIFNTIEWYMRRDTGVMRVWLNGALHLDYSDVVYPSQAWDESKGAPTWGGATGVFKSQNDYFRYGHVRLLKRA